MICSVLELSESTVKMLLASHNTLYGNFKGGVLQDPVSEHLAALSSHRSEPVLGIQRSLLPVSSCTAIFWGGVPTLMLTRYNNCSFSRDAWTVPLPARFCKCGLAPSRLCLRKSMPMTLGLEAVAAELLHGMSVRAAAAVSSVDLAMMRIFLMWKAGLWRDV